MMSQQPRLVGCLVALATACSAGSGSSSGSSGSGPGDGGASSGSPTPVTITFDALALGADGTVTVADQYLPHAQFVVGPEFAARAYNPPSSLNRPSEPLVLTVQNLANPGEYSLSEPLDVVFPGRASSVRFFVLGVNTQGRFANVVVTLANGSVQTVELTGLGTPSQPIEVNLETQGQMQRLRVQDIQDSFGVAYDSFSFTVP